MSYLFVDFAVEHTGNLLCNDNCGHVKPMIVGIVGHEAAKFTPEMEFKARECIRSVFSYDVLGNEIIVDKVVSGGCHLGGIDIWAVDEAKKLGIDTEEFIPQVLNWSEGFKPRNIQIAEAADKVICIVVKDYPEGYIGMKFDSCYHCKSNTHIKSGGCWTMKYALKIGKLAELIII